MAVTVVTAKVESGTVQRLDTLARELNMSRSDIVGLILDSATTDQEWVLNRLTAKLAKAFAAMGKGKKGEVRS